MAQENMKNGEKAFIMTNEMFMIINYDRTIDELKKYSGSH